MRRIFPVILISLLVNFFLFLMMTQMLTGKKVRPKEQVDFRGIELIDFKVQDKAPKKIKAMKAKRPALPEAPPPLKITTLSPAVQPKPVRPLPVPQKLKRSKLKIEEVKAIIPSSPPIKKVKADPPPPVPILPSEENPIPTIVLMQKVAAPTEKHKPEVVEIQRVQAETLEIAPTKMTPQATESEVDQTHTSEEKLPSSEEVQMTEDIEVDVLPLLRTQPRYPRRAIRAKLEGMVTIEFTIRTDGTVADPIVVASAPPKIFDRAALRAIRLWKFRPKQVQGKAVIRRAIQNIRFSLKSGKK